MIPESFFDNIGRSDVDSTLSYTPHAAITILSDDDFILQGWPGGGVSWNPYRISGLEITSGSIAIRIEDTTADFLIENCFISDGTNTGIRLVNVSDGIIEDVYIDSISQGVYAYDITNLDFTNITMISDSDNMRISYSESINVRHCHFEGIYGIGISLESVTGSVVEYNTFIDKKILIYDSLTTDISHNVITNDIIEVQNTVNILIENNTISNPSDPAININSGSSVCFIGDNLIEDSTDYGISLDDVNTLGLINNTVRSGESTLFNLYKCSTCVLEKNDADFSNDFGYFVEECTNILLLNNTARNCYDGSFYNYNSNSVNLTLNKAYRDYAPTTGVSGISVIECSSSTISQNDIRDHYFGILVGQSNFTDITMNVVQQNDDTGIYAASNLHTDFNNNRAFNNLDKGIEIHSSDYSTLYDNVLCGNSGAQLFIMTSDHAYINTNNASHANNVGLDIQQCDDCTIINNIVHDIHGNGMYIHSLSNIMMSKNKAYDIAYSGLYLKYVHNSTIETMTTHSCEYYGVRIELSTNITLNSCSSYNNVRDDVFLESSQECTLSKCTLGDRGLFVEGEIPIEWVHTITQTTVTSGEVMYLYDELLSVFDGSLYGQLFIVNGSAVVVNDGEFYNHTNGVTVVYSTSVTLNGITSYDCTDGFQILESISVTLDHCRSYRNSWHGIVVVNSPDTSIESCTMYDQIRGIDVDESPNLLVDNCVLNDHSSFGAYIQNSDFSMISDCDSTNDFNAGFTILYSNNCTLINNEVINTGSGIILIECINGTIENNRIDNLGGSMGINVRDSIDCLIILNQISNSRYAGIHVEDSSNMTIDENEMVQCGLLITGNSLDYWQQTIGLNNLVNSKPLGVFVSVSSTIIYANDYGQLFIDDCEDVIISGASFINATSPLIIVQSENITASDFSISGGQYGAMLLFSSHCTLENFTLVSTSQTGIFMDNVSNTTIYDVSVTQSYRGIYLSNSDFNIISECTVSNISDAAFRLASVDDCLFNLNLMYYSNYGFHIVYSFRNNFTANSVIYNNLGIYLLSASENNLFLENEIGWNTLHNAWDTVVGNIWDNGIDTGNAWSDYISGGYYTVYGTAGAIDGFPRTLTILATVIESPGPITFWRTVSSTALQWNVTIQYPSHYNILLNGSLYSSNVWRGPPIIVDLTTLPVGVQTFTLQVFTISGGFESDTVVVTVLDPTIPIIDEPEDIEYVIGETGFSISWNPTDPYPASYKIYRNSVLIEEDTWDGSQISINVDGLTVGTWIYEIVVYSLSMSANDTVLVIVTEFTTSSTTTTSTTTSDVNTTTTTGEGNTTTTAAGSFGMTLIIVVGVGGIAVVILLAIILKKKKVPAR